MEVNVIWAKEGVYRVSLRNVESTGVERANTSVYLASLILDSFHLIVLTLNLGCTKVGAKFGP